MDWWIKIIRIIVYTPIIGFLTSIWSSGHSPAPWAPIFLVCAKGECSSGVFQHNPLFFQLLAICSSKRPGTPNKFSRACRILLHSPEFFDQFLAVFRLAASKHWFCPLFLCGFLSLCWWFFLPIVSTVNPFRLQCSSNLSHVDSTVLSVWWLLALFLLPIPSLLMCFISIFSIPLHCTRNACSFSPLFQWKASTFPGTLLCLS